MKDLIAKLEAATEGGWELDFAIQQKLEGWENLGGGWRKWTATGKEEQYNCGMRPPHYTTSLDAALTLVLQGCVWEISKTDSAAHPRVFYSARVEDDEYSVVTNAATPALALCIASLKARGS
jgi:hypothetical protein